MSFRYLFIYSDLQCKCQAHENVFLVFLTSNVKICAILGDFAEEVYLVNDVFLRTTTGQ